MEKYKVKRFLLTVGGAGAQNEIFTVFNKNILRAKKIGSYDGAYKVIYIAIKNM